ncbi:MAG: restriction endonuclease subunit S [Methanobrevibacter sp.]|uniref:restriction endonuclease subunit S n=1 Tax=Methanobrevibacter sp. TaxID=66852 RepID=UPI003EFEF6FE
MKSNYSKLGNYITESKLKNKDSSETNLVGLSNEKQFTDSKANIIGADLSKYKLIAYNQFVYMPTTSRNGDKISVALFKEKGGIISSSYTVFDVDADLLNPDYLMLWFERPEFDRYARYHSHGSVREIFSWEDMENTELFVPPLEHQNKVVEIKNLIDDRITILKNLSKNLDETCHTIFKYYFIDFTPFINEKFIDSKIGKIPKGWNITSVGDILDCKLGGTPSRSNESYWGGNIAWINSGKVNEFRIIEPSEYITEEGLKKSATKLLPAKTTVIAITGATLGQISLLEIDSCANQSVIGVVPNKKYPYEFIYPLISSILFELLKHQTGGAQQHINKENLESFNIICPPEDIISEYKNIVHPLYSQISANCFEIEKLQKLRDTLIAKLMTGEIDVSKINVS